MNKKKINLALISPSKNVYSETFIQNHKKYFDANVKFYYGGYLPTFLEEEAHLGLSRIERISRYIKKYIFKQNLKYSDSEKALINSFKKHNIDAAFAEFGPTGAEVLKVCQAMQLPLIVNFHGADISVYDIIERYKEQYENFFKYSSKIIAVSKQMYNRLIDMRCPVEKLEYITYGPANSFFYITPTYNEKAFLSVGRFVDKKAPYYTILAMKKVTQKHPDAKLYMVGDGPLLNACVNLVSYLKLDNNVIFLGVLNHEQLISYYTKVKAFVQHSVTAANGDMEGTPVAILEASAAGIPVISTKHAGIPDVIIDNNTGFLVEEHDVEGMAEKMIKLFDNPQLAETMGKAGRKNTFENYRMERHIDKLNKVIHNVIK